MRAFFMLLLLWPAAAAASDPSQVPPYPPPQILLAEDGPCEAYYPYDEHTKGIGGTTTLAVTIHAYGYVEAAVVTSSSGNANLDEAAKACISHRRFAPSVELDKDGKPLTRTQSETVEWKAPHPPAFAEPPHDCPHSYPVTMVDLVHTSGVTEIRFSIAGGRVRDAAVVQTSGNPALDNAGVSCVKTRRFERSGGTASAFRERIYWANGLGPLPGAPVVPQTVGYPHVCINDYPPISQRLGEQGAATVQFVIAADGSVKDPAIAVSTGSERLDQASITCVAKWHYWPVVVDGKVIEPTWRARLNWSLH